MTNDGSANVVVPQANGAQVPNKPRADFCVIATEHLMGNDVAAVIIRNGMLYLGQRALPDVWFDGWVVAQDSGCGRGRHQRDQEGVSQPEFRYFLAQGIVGIARVLSRRPQVEIQLSALRRRSSPAGVWAPDPRLFRAALQGSVVQGLKNVDVELSGSSGVEWKFKCHKHVSESLHADANGAGVGSRAVALGGGIRGNVDQAIGVANCELRRFVEGVEVESTVIYHETGKGDRRQCTDSSLLVGGLLYNFCAQVRRGDDA